MSIEASAWAWKILLPANQKLVLLALADHSDQNGICWPGSKGLVAKTGISRSTVIRARQELEKSGIIIVSHRTSDDKVHSTNIYRMNFEYTATPPPSVTATPPPSVTATPPPSVTATPPPSVTATPPLVSPRHHPSVTVTPEPLLNHHKSTTTTPPPQGGGARTHTREAAILLSEAFPEIIPKAIHGLLITHLRPLDASQANDVTLVLAERLGRAKDGKSTKITNPSSYIAALVSAVSSGKLQVPQAIIEEKKSNELAEHLSQLHQSWTSGMEIVVDGNLVHPDPWPYISINHGTATIAAIISDGGIVEARQPMCASP